MNAVRLHARSQRRKELGQKGVKVKPLPERAAVALQWDVTTPLRPWEWWQVDAEEWTFARDVHAAYRQGVDDANAEKRA